MNDTVKLYREQNTFGIVTTNESVKRIVNNMLTGKEIELTEKPTGRLIYIYKKRHDNVMTAHFISRKILKLVEKN